MQIDLSNIPRTINIVRANAAQAPIPEGFPIAVILDQSKLPSQTQYIYATDWRVVMDAIKTLKVRGAPAIGIAGAVAMTLRAAEFCYAQDDPNRTDEYDFDRVFIIDQESFNHDLYLMSMQFCAEMIDKTRPTAKNLKWALDKCMQLVNSEIEAGSGAKAIADKLFKFSEGLIASDESINKTIGQFGSTLLGDNSTILTHCNAGSLATAFYGTALGVVYSACQQGKIKRVYADETRPVNQGSRLTVWELSKAGVPVTLICDDMAASIMSSGEIDAVIVGADRVAANGDVANKIGTLGVAILANYYKIPFYVAAPSSSVDLNIQSGDCIKIEHRDAAEVLPNPIDGVEVYNPAFDITPSNLVTGIITEYGIFKPSEICQGLNDAIK
jgi:methylthioribose-1-phosphate isomerase